MAIATASVDLKVLKNIWQTTFCLQWNELLVSQALATI